MLRGVARVIYLRAPPLAITLLKHKKCYYFYLFFYKFLKNKKKSTRYVSYCAECTGIRVDTTVHTDKLAIEELSKILCKSLSKSVQFKYNRTSIQKQ